MEAEGLPRVRLAGAKGSGKQQGDSQPLHIIAYCSVLQTGCFAQWFLVLWQCHELDSSPQLPLGGGQAGHQREAWVQMGRQCTWL